MLRPAAREASQDLLGLRRAEPQRGGVLDELVVLLGDEVPVDRAGRDLVEAGVARVVGGPVQAGRADVLQPGEQLEAEEVAEREADHRGAVGVLSPDSGARHSDPHTCPRRGPIRTPPAVCSASASDSPVSAVCSRCFGPAMNAGRVQRGTDRGVVLLSVFVETIRDTRSDRVNAAAVNSWASPTRRGRPWSRGAGTASVGFSTQRISW